jgi:hypothetical protein
MTPGNLDRTAQDADRRMALAAEWEDLVAQARELDGFADFLRPPDLASLLPAAAGGPVVILNLSRWRCDALIVTTSGVDLVPLPGLTSELVVAQTQAYLDAVGVQQEQEAADGAASRKDVEEALDGCLRWMWDAFAGRILDHLGFTSTPTGDWPRIWWCPTGPLTLLPIHAAGNHRVAGEAVLDRVISSYTPTLRALLEARSDPGDRLPGVDRMLSWVCRRRPNNCGCPTRGGSRNSSRACSKTVARHWSVRRPPGTTSGPDCALTAGRISRVTVSRTSMTRPTAGCFCTTAG